MSMSTPTGRCGPCCSIAPTGRTATTLLMSAAAKSRQLISAQNLVGGMQVSKGSNARGDGLDLDLELGPRETLHDQERGGRRRIAHEFVARFHVAAERLARRHVGVDADDVLNRHRGFRQDRSDGEEAEPRLGLGALRNNAVLANPQLP